MLNVHSLHDKHTEDGLFWSIQILFITAVYTSNLVLFCLLNWNLEFLWRHWVSRDSCLSDTTFTPSHSLMHIEKKIIQTKTNKNSQLFCSKWQWSMFRSSLFGTHPVRTVYVWADMNSFDGYFFAFSVSEQKNIVIKA